MAKIIRLTDELIDKFTKEFGEKLKASKISDGKVQYTKTLNTTKRRATVYFTEKAWVKMTSLVDLFDEEVAWHGIATRSEDESKDEYTIHDILVYPQEVTGATVNTDQEKYQMWLMGHDDDTFNNIRMQGHSHVRMATTPSSVDLTHQEKILEQLEGDMFYIFMIWNKYLSKNIKIYDMKKNILFETEDVDVRVMEGDIGLQSFLRESADMVVEKKAPVGAYGGTGAYGGAYQGGYSGGYYGSESGGRGTYMSGGPYNPVPRVENSQKSQKKKTNDYGAKGGKTKTKMDSSWKGSADTNHGVFTDEEEDPYGPFFAKEGNVNYNLN